MTTTAPARQVTQTILHEQDGDVPGNCLQAAVASLLDLDLNVVPHFITHDDWLNRLIVFGQEHGYLVRCEWQPETPTPLGIAIGPSPRGVQHAVVVIDDETAWDPHPSRAGLLSVSLVLEFTPLPEAGGAR
ncbi:hypothetical protein [Actinacidiphila acididurans]|uniref:Uncharacterized protein n=1 Tax=Actinacidiphila acididurans TaxID=2784346 RepID=A0ABS2U315_9ACTN|nr:hypothetical protein [Actinacidiphila acididurans]MBM9509976.1 hypothetical protein [Actinacidiphila acididurans]